MAINTYGITLKWGESATDVKKVVDIKDFPDMIGDPEMLETTTLSDAQVTNIPGIKGSDMLTFTCNYTKADFTAVNADAEKPLHYALEFSDGSKFTWQGQHTCGLPGKGVNEVVEFTINIAASSPVEFAAT
ncbi:MAG: hypothetical protein J6S05_05470 [Bacteroidaceae bacterium]|nr:hypothetical protein [Bacteroidaceae bacterium]